LFIDIVAKIGEQRASDATRRGYCGVKSVKVESGRRTAADWDR